MAIARVSTGGRFEKIGAYSRAKRVGPFIFVSGTTAIEPSGRLHAPYDTYKQSIYILERTAETLSRLGAELRHVVRTRAFLADISRASEFARAHGKVFRGIDPVTSGVEAGLTMPGMMVEIEFDALIHDADGVVSY